MLLGRVPPLAQLQSGQELLQDGGAVAVPVGWLARPPLHDLVFHNLLNPAEAEAVLSKCLQQNYRPAHQPHAKLASPEAPLLPLCLSADIPTPLATMIWKRKKKW